MHLLSRDFGELTASSRLALPPSNHRSEPDIRVCFGTPDGLLMPDRECYQHGLTRDGGTPEHQLSIYYREEASSVQHGWPSPRRLQCLHIARQHHASQG